MRLPTLILLLLLSCGLLAQDETKKEHPENRLAKEKSPYLLQHARNPVDWYPWGKEAFELSKKTGKPIFLSIGYATCHWCHVMERESFENEEIAAYLNKHFICVKLDREERPDVDQIYMNYQIAASGSGGWPLNVWLTPELKPFFAGTYFPPEDKGGRPGFGTVLERLNKAWIERKDEITEGSAASAKQLETLFKSAPPEDGSTLGAESIEAAYASLRQRFDESFAGFGGAPKFPQPVRMEFLLQYSLDDAHAEGDRKGAEMMARATLDAIAAGGIHDHLGGGFHRYSVDRSWRVPHFEKMLYDQAQLAGAYLDAYLVTGEETYANVVRGLFSYVDRQLKGEHGGFYSAEDADAYETKGDSEKKEGAFHVWTKKEILELLGEENGEVFCAAYGVREDGNCPSEGDPHGELKGKNVLHIALPLQEVANSFGKTPEEVAPLLTASSKTLFEHRNKRTRPILDDKVLCSWNGMMISAYARAYQALGDEAYLETANKAADFVLANLRDPESGELLRTWREGPSDILAFSEDYAYLIEALIELYESDFDHRRLAEAIRLQEEMLEHFGDEKAGGFFDARPAPDLIMRLKSMDDGVVPSANSTATRNLLRLAKMTGRDDFSKAADSSIAGAAAMGTEAPGAVLKMLEAVRIRESGGIQVVLAGEKGSEGIQKLLRSVHQRPQRNRVLLLSDGAEGQKLLAEKNPAAFGMNPLDGKPTLYLCIDFACRRPTADPKEIEALLGEVLGN